MSSKSTTHSQNVVKLMRFELAWQLRIEYLEVLIMKITFVGVGGAFASSDYWQSNAYLWNENNSKIFLIDCGGDARHGLAELGVNHKNIEAVYISHLHTDHCGGLEWLGFCTYFDPNCGRPKLFIMRELIAPLWETLKAGMQSLEGKVLELESFFDVVPLEKNESFKWEDCKMTPFQTIHVMNGNIIVPSYGLMMETKNQSTLFTSDTQFNPRMDFLYSKADLIFHDCETTPFKSGVHAHYDELNSLPEETKNKMWLYHYAANPKQDFESNGFMGFVNKGQTFDI